jgi:hypothetical protein
MSEPASHTTTTVELQPGQWFQVGSELWLLVWFGGQCLRFEPSGFAGMGLQSANLPVTVVEPWFQITRRLRPTRLANLAVGDWFQWAGQPMLVTSGPLRYLAFDPLTWNRLQETEIVVPLWVRVRTDRKPWFRQLSDWWRSL